MNGDRRSWPRRQSTFVTGCTILPSFQEICAGTPRVGFQARPGIEPMTAFILASPGREDEGHQEPI
jgi:hypothetical protein